jgi:hypothetical protein
VTALPSPAKNKAGATWIDRWLLLPPPPRPMATNSGMNVPKSPQLPVFLLLLVVELL